MNIISIPQSASLTAPFAQGSLCFIAYLINLSNKISNQKIKTY